ncbi:MAG: cell division FtsA domain-containing protein, partial [Pseudomonadota bacterium]
ALFLRGAFVFADLVRIGAEQITLDLVRNYDLPRAEAERLKVLEGSAVDLSAGAPPIDMATVAPSYAAGAARGGISRADLAATIRPRVIETLSLARDRLAQAGFSYLPRRRVVLTGGGADLGGVLETAQEVFGPAVRVGRPLHAEGAPVSLAGPAFAALAGLARHAADPPAALQAPKPAAASPSGVSGLWRWLRETW